jgi:hypothetical protein
VQSYAGSMSDRERILDRLTKLLALSRSSNPNEAATAGRLADRLMKEHELALADVEGFQPAGIFEKSMGSKGFETVWKFSLVTATARFYGCEAVALNVGPRRKIRLVGDKSDVEKAAELFESFLLTLKQLEKIEAQRLALLSDVEIETSPKQYIDSFRRGVTVSIIERMQEMRSPASSSFAPSPFAPSAPPAGPAAPSAAPVAPESPLGKSWLSKFWPWKKHGEAATVSPDGDSSSDILKSLVLMPCPKKDERGYREKVKSKYSPRKVKLRLEDADDDGAYWRGYELARQLVVLPLDE